MFTQYTRRITGANLSQRTINNIRDYENTRCSTSSANSSARGNLQYETQNRRDKVLDDIAGHFITATFCPDDKKLKLVDEYKSTIRELTPDAVDATTLVQKYKFTTTDLVDELYKSYLYTNLMLYHQGTLDDESSSHKSTLTISDVVGTRNVINTTKFNLGGSDDFTRYVFMDMIDRALTKNSIGYDSIYNNKTYLAILRTVYWAMFEDKDNFNSEDITTGINTIDKITDFVDEIISHVKFSNYDTKINIDRILNRYCISSTELVYVASNTLNCSDAYANETDKNLSINKALSTIFGSNDSKDSSEQYINMKLFNTLSFDDAFLAILARTICAKLNGKSVYNLKF